MTSFRGNRAFLVWKVLSSSLHWVWMASNECSIYMQQVYCSWRSQFSRLLSSFTRAHRLFTGQQLHHLSTGALQQPYFAIPEEYRITHLRAHASRSVGSAPRRGESVRRDPRWVRATGLVGQSSFCWRYRAAWNGMRATIKVGQIVTETDTRVRVFIC